MSSTQRVLRPRKQQPNAPAKSGERTQRKRLRRHATQLPDTPQPLKLPVELLLLILKEVDSLATLARASRVCRMFQNEAEHLLYREVTVRRVPDVRSLHRALTKVPRRASLVYIFHAIDNGRMSMVLDLLNAILLMLNNLKDLDLDLTTCFEKPELHHKVLQTLSNCAFRLESYSGYVGSDGEFVRFLKRQPGIESLGIKDAVLDFPDQSFPQDVLPRLKFLQTDYDFFLSIVRHPRMITHLDLSSWPMDDHEVDNILQVVGGQLVSFKYAKDSDPEFPVGQPSHVLRGGALPRLKFLDVGDFMENGHKSCFDLQADLEYMTDPTVALERLVWSTVWETYPHRDGAFDELNGRLAFARIWADRVLRARRSLREIYYIERDLIYNEAFETGVLFTLSADGTLLQQDRKEQEIPVWSDV